MSVLLYEIICILQPICLPLPETTTILSGCYLLGPTVAFLLGVFGTVAGISIMYLLARYGAGKVLRKYIDHPLVQKYQIFIEKHKVLITGMLFIVPVFPDEIICFGAGLSELPLASFILIAFISKAVAFSLVAFSKEIGGLVHLSQWEIICIELFVLFSISCIIRLKKGRNENEESIHTTTYTS